MNRMNEVGAWHARELVRKALAGVTFDLTELDIITDDHIEISALASVKLASVKMSTLVLIENNLLS